MEKAPLVTLVTPTYNSSKTLHDTLKSVAMQDYPNLEHIIIDGLSKDNTIEIANQYPHIAKIVSERDGGIFDAMNKGVKMANGEIVGILNSDDFYTHEQVISNLVKQMLEANADSVYGDLAYVDAEDTSKVVRIWKSGKYRVKSFFWGWMPPHPAFFVKKWAYERYGYFKPELRVSGDYELMLRFLLKHKISSTHLPDLVVKMRNGGNSSGTWKNRIRANKEDRKSWEINGLKPYFFTMWLKPVSKIGQFIKTT